MRGGKGKCAWGSGTVRGFAPSLSEAEAPSCPGFFTTARLRVPAMWRNMADRYISELPLVAANQVFISPSRSAGGLQGNPSMQPTWRYTPPRSLGTEFRNGVPMQVECAPSSWAIGRERCSPPGGLRADGMDRLEA